MNEVSKIEARPPLEDGIRPDFVPANRNTDSRVFELEKERLWPRIWHIAAREEELPNVGDYVTYEVLDEPIILVRTAGDTIRAYYNVCQHRGRRLVNPGAGHPTDAAQCIFDIWSLNRYAPGTEPEVTRNISNGFEEARGRNAFLEQDFANMEAVELGMRSRGWSGARTNPAEESTVTHFHKMLDQFYTLPPLECT